jgi:dTDP-4-dehydrorhamnose reductase
MDSLLNPMLILGKTGQIGSGLVHLLGKQAYAAGREEADFTDSASFAPLLDKLNPAAIINAVAYTQVDKAESEEALAYRINAEAPEVLAQLAKERGIPFVHYSTDYVFPGQGTTPFRETDATAPLNAYGRSKRAGEEQIAAIGGKYLIFRTSWVFDGRGKNFLTTMLRLGAERKELSIVADQIGAPSYAPHLAKATLDALHAATAMQRFPSGIYHLCNAGHTSWHGFATAIFEEARQAGMEMAVETCNPIPSSDYPTPATRPLNSQLDCRKLANIFGIALPDWRDGVREAMAERKFENTDRSGQQ